MLFTCRTSSWGMLAAGLIVGLAIGGAMIVGVLVGRRADSVASLPGLADLHLKAMASHGGDNFAIATGPVDEDVEGLFTLDFLTGELHCFVMNPRAGGLAGAFKANVASDLEVQKGKKPNYLIATGAFNFSASYNNFKPAKCLVYVADGNTGDIACYTFPWSSTVTNSGGLGTMLPMSLVYKGKTRTVAIRGK
jgi:hypothetical protein